MVMPKGDWKPAVVFAALTLTFFSISGYFYQNGFPDFGYSFLGLAVTEVARGKHHKYDRCGNSQRFR